MRTALITLLFGVATLAAAQDCRDGQRLFDHAHLVGDAVCIPTEPQRVVALDMSALELSLMAGTPVVATASWLLDEYPVILPETADALDDLRNVGYPADLESVLLADPDLILTTEDAIDVAAARQIAPTVVASSAVLEDWRTGAEIWSEALGAENLMDRMVVTYTARIAELREALGPDRGEIEVSLIGASTYGISLWLPDTAPGGIVADAGLGRPAPQALSPAEAQERYGATRWVMISEERLDLADGDVIFLYTYAAPDPETRAEERAFIEDLRSDPLWRSLGAVRADRSYLVGSHWWRAHTYQLANDVIDDLFEILADTSAATDALPLEPR
jgi:iron complex transport system substrate-binding protein